MKYILFLEDASSAPFKPEDFLNKIFGNFWSLLINLLALIVLFIVLFLVAYKPVKKYVEKRRDYIEGNIHDAEVAKSFYEDKVAKSDEIISSAQKEGQEIIKNAEMNAKKEADSIIAKAKEDARNEESKAIANIEAEKQKAQAEIHAQIVNVALEASKEILGREIDKKDNEKLLSDFTNDLEKKG